MAETEKKHALREEPTGISSGFHEWHPFDTLRHQINKLFDELPFRKVFSEFGGAESGEKDRRQNEVARRDGWSETHGDSIRFASAFKSCR